MLIAEQIAPDGMKVGSAFMQALTNLIAREKLTKIIETGTYLGQGTTRAVIEGVKKHRKPFEFYSIECNPSYYRQAWRNTPPLKGVHLVLGLSIDRESLPKAVEFTGYPDHIVVDFRPEVREQSYLLECDYDVKDNCLKEALEKFEFTPDLVILDSAGHIGEKEFDYLVKYSRGEFYLALDDINHVKHFNSARKLIDGKAQIIFSSDEKFGSLIAKVQIH